MPGTGTIETPLPKLGKREAKWDKRTLVMATYLRSREDSVLPVPQPEIEWGEEALAWPMFRNNEIGLCAFATIGHMIRTWTLEAKPTEVILPDQTIIDAYSAVTGYNPADSSTDQGAYVLDALKYWRTIGVGGHKIDAFIALEPRNRDHVRIANHLFGGIYLGLGLPISAQRQLVWSVPPQGTVGEGGKASWGGHAVACIAHNRMGPICISWGRVQPMTWDFFETYTDESYACISQDWMRRSGRTPSGFDMAHLLQDINEIAPGTVRLVVE